jgi:hypothetical protein
MSEEESWRAFQRMERQVYGKLSYLFAIKYLCRHKQKGQRKDLEKAIHYCQMAIDRDYPEKEKTVSEKLQDELEPITDFGKENK